MYPYYRGAYPIPDQRFLGWGLGWPLAAGGLGFLGGLIGGGLIGGALASRPFYGGFGYPGFGCPGMGYPGMGFGGYPYFY
ncbi:hypothetical protein [Bacillus sp. EB600]|uniref:hypothetical protein n=1 Tax=Bacillus sp. EB600 TaxID=2806345 RepID=UPI00210E6AC3|nr:hypothetical protein [Bacillus sp. EB600]MCQ6278952.1 hypothetical protein [Bacillus sp. EB600]